MRPLSSRSPSRNSLRNGEPATNEYEKKISLTPTDTVAWKPERGGFRRRLYRSYEEYLEHQKSKLSRIDLSSYQVEFRNRLRQRIAALGVTKRGDTVLCLGARLGTECLAFVDLGCFAVGIDLNPGDQNQYVLYGDFHNLQFPDSSVDHIFTNALDHSFDLDRVIDEAKRVMRPQGTFIAEIVRGSRDIDGREPGAFESYWWDHVNEAIGVIERHGFEIEQRHRFSYPWQGDQIVFRRSEAKELG